MKNTPLEEIRLYYPVVWEDQYRANSLIREWVREYPDQFEDWMSDGVKKGTTALFSQYCLMYLLRRDYGICSLTWYKLCSDALRSTNEERTLRYWATMKLNMGKAKFELLQGDLKACGFRNFDGEPDLFCWNPETSEWYFAEAKGRRDKLKPVQQKWMRVYRSILPEAPDIRIYHLLPTDSAEKTLP